MSYVTEVIEKFKRQHLEELLSQCTEKQRTRFHEIFWNGVTSKEMDSVLALVHRTIVSNAESKLAEHPHAD